MRVIAVCLIALMSVCATGVVRAQAETDQVAEQSSPAPAVAAQANLPAVKPAEAKTAESKAATSAPTAGEVIAFLGLFVLGGGALLFVHAFTVQIKAGNPVGIESHWGGLGGGLGGWRVSNALSCLIGCLVFAGAFSALAFKLLDHDLPSQPVATQAPAETAGAQSDAGAQ